jgi:putative spermidine/putrescine transport system substrate-binding protein
MHSGFGSPPTRRRVLAATAAGAFAGTFGKPFLAARAAESLVVRDPGGVWSPAATEAFYKPFSQATGIEVVGVAAAHDPIAQVKAMVETKSYVWDAINLGLPVQKLLGEQGYLEEVDATGTDVSELMPEAKTKWWLGTDAYATVYGYQVDKFPTPPQSWAEVWDAAKFPGSRSLRKYPVETFEIALLADGVAPDKLYPLDVDRAFKKLEQIKSAVSVWWTSGAQASQMLKTAEVDICATWNGRAQAAIDDGAKVKIGWNQGLYTFEGFAIAKGNPKADLARKFVKFCANAKQQSIFAHNIAYGPTNPGAYETIEPERAEILPTSPAHLKNLVQLDIDYWSKNQEKAIERFDAWLLS